MSGLTIEFLGAAGEVTGSCFRVDAGSARFLVDCGMFQGGGDADAKNAAALPFDVAALDFVIVTHAHIDHSGLLPLLYARGFRGPVYATPATIDLLGVMLPDSAHIQEKEAEWARERRAGAPRSGDASHRESRPAADAQSDARHEEAGRPPRERRAGAAIARSPHSDALYWRPLAPASGRIPVHARGPGSASSVAPLRGDASHRESRPAADAQSDARYEEAGRPPRERRGDNAPGSGDPRHRGARAAGAPQARARADAASEGDAAIPERNVAVAPLYTVADAERSLRLLRPVAYGAAFEPKPSIRFCFRDAGHILGSAIIELWLDGDRGARKFVFSGDLGQPGRPVMEDPTPIADADVLVVESTYGNRLHKSLASTYDELARVLSTTLPRGNVVIPAFAVGRTQEVLHVLADLVRHERVPVLSIFVDSPMAARATRITAKYAAVLDRESRDLTRWLMQHRDQVGLHFTETTRDSMAINGIRSGAVIIAAGGMCEGGRIRHHLRHNLPREECAIVFTGFQATGTLGRRIVDGATHVRLFREDIPVRASVHTIGGLSAHGDRAALLGWLSAFRAPPARVFIVHGEHDTALGFAQLIREKLRWPSVDVPQRGDSVRLA